MQSARPIICAKTPRSLITIFPVFISHSLELIGGLLVRSPCVRDHFSRLPPDRPTISTRRWAFCTKAMVCPRGVTA
jgi:hypothetical protein